jgi:hypothetical protein
VEDFATGHVFYLSILYLFIFYILSTQGAGIAGQFPPFPEHLGDHRRGRAYPSCEGAYPLCALDFAKVDLEDEPDPLAVIPRRLSGLQQDVVRW